MWCCLPSPARKAGHSRTGRGAARGHAAAVHAGATATVCRAREALPNLTGRMRPAGVRAEAGAGGARLQLEDEPGRDALAHGVHGQVVLD